MDSPISESSLKSATPSVGFKRANAARTTMRLIAIALLYLLIAWAFHAGTRNLFTTLIGGGDGLIYGLPSKIFATTFSSWNSYVQSGKFVYADVLTQSFYPPSLLILSIFPNTFGFNLFLLVHYALGGLFMYLFLGRLRLSTYSAFVGGLIFMLSGFMTAHKGHEYMICVAVWLPLTLYFIHRYAERLQITDLGYAAVPVALSILAGFPQITLYSTLLLLAYLFFCIAGSPLLRGWKTKLAHIGFAAAVVLGIGGLLGCLPLFSVAETLPYLTRERLTYEMFTADNFLPGQLFTSFIPNLFGGINYYVPPYLYALDTGVCGLDPYVAMLPLTLALAGIVAWRRVGRELRFWVAAGATALLLSFGATTPIYRLLFYVPVYNLFRAPGRHLFEVNLALSVIAAAGLDFLLRQSVPAHQDVARLVRRTIVIVSLLFGSALVAAVTLRSVAKGSFSQFLAVPDSAKPFILRNLSWNSATIFMPLLFFALTIAILVMLGRTRQRRTVMIAIPILIVADLFEASRGMYNNPSTEPLNRRAERPELAFLKTRQFDSKHYRLFPVDFDYDVTGTYPLLNMYYGLPVINDYGPFWLKRYQAVTGFGRDGDMPAPNLENYKLISLLGARYLMVLSPDSRHLIEQATLDSPESDEKVLLGPGSDTWVAYGASKIDQAGFTLRKPDNREVSLVEADVPLKPSTDYEVSFMAKADADLNQTPLVVDLFAVPVPTRSFKTLGKEPCRYRAVINSGPAAPTRAFLRLYTRSAAPIEIRDLQVKELGRGRAKAFYCVAATDGITIFENPNALPRFRFARRVTPARNVEDALCLMRQPGFDPADEAFVEGIDSGGDVAPGKFLSERLEDTRLEWDVETLGRSFLVVADSFFPGWTATVDGRPVPIYAVYGCVRGVSIESAGRHHVEMSFVPRTLYAGLGCTGIGFLFLGILCFRERTGRFNRLPFS